MALANILRSLVQVDEMGGGAMPEAPTEVEGVDIRAAPRPKKEVLEPMAVDSNAMLIGGAPTAQLTPPVAQTPVRSNLNYNNSLAQEDLQTAVSGIKPRGGSANEGIYGLLPEKMRYGTVRNILGAIGDAFLVQSGNEATYAPRMDRQRIGLAMAGLDPNDPASVQAAIQRVAATGAPESIELADRMQKNFGDTELRKQAAEDTNLYRQSQTESRQDAALQRMLPYASAGARAATSKEAYRAAYQRADAIAKRIGPQYSASDFGLIDPEEWSPEAAAAAGLTSNNLLTSEDRGKGRATSERNTDVNAGSRVRSAQISAGARIRTAEMAGDRATSAVILQGLIDKQNSGQQLTSAEQATFDKMTALPASRKGRALPASVTVKGGAKPAAKPAGRQPGATDIQYLKANPGERAKFDAYFGKGASAKYLGK